MVTVGVDFAYTETIRDVLRAIRAHEGKIVDFDPDGPAGGNPVVLLGFDNEGRRAALPQGAPPRGRRRVQPVEDSLMLTEVA